MQLAYLFHQYAKSLLSTDGRIADCTVRHSGVERPFSSVSFCSLIEEILFLHLKLYRCSIVELCLLNYQYSLHFEMEDIKSTVLNFGFISFKLEDNCYVIT